MKKWLPILVPLLTLVIGMFLGAWWEKGIPEAKGKRCNNNLRYIDAAKEQAAQEFGLPAGAVVTVEQCVRYIREGKLPECPSGGMYSLNPVGQVPTCSLGSQSPGYWHKLP